MRKALMMLALFALTAFHSAVKAGCGSTGSGCAGRLHCAEHFNHQNCSCVDPYCFSPSNGGCLSQEACCRHFGNIGAGGFEDEYDPGCGAHCNDYSYNDETVVYKGDYKGEHS